RRIDIGVKGTVPMAYQWLHDGMAIPGATNFVLSLANVQLSQDGLYSCVISNPVGITVSSNAHLSVDIPPAIDLVSPHEGQIFLAPATIILDASATDIEPTGSVARVEFFLGSEQVGVATNAPYLWTTNGLSSGRYAFTARAMDNEGAWAT